MIMDRKNKVQVTHVQNAVSEISISTQNPHFFARDGEEEKNSQEATP